MIAISHFAGGGKWPVYPTIEGKITAIELIVGMRRCKENEDILENIALVGIVILSIQHQHKILHRSADATNY
jgi:hypothetical protein